MIEVVRPPGGIGPEAHPHDGRCRLEAGAHDPDRHAIRARAERRGTTDSDHERRGLGAGAAEGQPVLPTPTITPQAAASTARAARTRSAWRSGMRTNLAATGPP